MHSYMHLYGIFTCIYIVIYARIPTCILARISTCILTRIQHAFIHEFPIHSCDIHMLIHATFIHLAVFIAVTKRMLILTRPFLYVGIVSYHVSIFIRLVVF